ncbi:winged helix-turn-helix domain-containing protein [Citrobacter amalonaticus]|uniref:Winged helix-turn-helix domain-containing protein n=1 Tax=Citrobacter amalonaticus TaxID=35703 RepID=A0AAW9LXH5_CITAM|nr:MULTISPECIES: winged helix-turn-helix domain-containing protein [Citrobacter]MDU1755844.1 winged helix-turn-helix domain-containing protein [Citrobacter sp.]ELR9582506.1 YcaQ family DNA glycosylase [Citrobacter amalonaticus]MDT7069965.1 winged helix-turn-helix domain-containing protein [Citrobacter amalonaticus]MDV2135904.1 winged helix-turn-helix domain-containing protein [Citrobacter amalonaticus]MEB0583410.1 winged helix-turn-helix domain-containing protein [Citrobacter amalonaticus]
MSLPYLSLTDARNLHLAAQGLLKKPRRRALASDILPTITRMSLLQIDTINIVARSPYLVLFSRLGNYTPQWLDDALAQGELMEYWAHEACFLPRSDFTLIRHRMLAPEKMGWKYQAAWMEEHAGEIEQLLQHIHQNGPVRSADFEHPRKGNSGWWDWKPHKLHLEGLFTAGKVMVIERRNFQRVYDLTHRVMPHWDDERDLLPRAQAESVMLDNSARSLGIFREQWLADYYRLKRPELQNWRDVRAEQQYIIPVEVEKLGRLWLHADLLPQLEQAQAGKLTATHSAVLSPFDPVVWDRKRAEQLFDFSYRLECYTPAPKRQYGYFVLPLLHRGQLVGRMDAKMHRKTGVLEVISLYLQEGVKPGVTLQNGLQQAITDFARWQNAVRVTLGRCPAGIFTQCRQGWEIDAVA